MAGASLLAMIPAGVRTAAWAAGSDAPEKKEVKIGFIPLTDCASVVIASELKFDEKYGIKMTPSKEASWAAVRDKLVNGELDAAHVLYGLIYGVHLGIGGPKKDMAVLATLNHNGQAITLSSQLKDKGAVDGTSLKKLIDREKRAVVTKWPVTGSQNNVTVALDEPNHRLFLVTRTPPQFVVMDSENGKQITLTARVSGKQ